MRIEPKAAFYNEETGAVQPWKDIEVTDSVGNALVSEGLAIAIAEGGGGGTGSGITWIPVTTVTPGLEWTLGNTYAEIKELVDAGTPVGIIYDPTEHGTGMAQCVGCTYDNPSEGAYSVTFANPMGYGGIVFYAASEDGTLTLNLGD